MTLKKRNKSNATTAWKALRAIAALTCIMTALAACHKQPRKFVIAVSQCSVDVWRDKLWHELKTGEYLNDSITVKLASSHDDNKRQTEQINSFVDEGVDLLIVSPNHLDSITPAIDRAYDNGIPVILYDRKTRSDKYTAFIGCDNYIVGKTMGTFIAKRMGGHGRVVEICGMKGASPAIERHRGFMDALKDFPGIEVAASVHGNWKEESGAKAMRRILATTKDFDYVFAHNDRMAIGARAAAHQMNTGHEYRYTGVDAMAYKGGGLEMVIDSILDASYLYPTRGEEVINLAMRILTHKPFERENNMMSSIITRDNADITLMEARESERQRKDLSYLHHRVDQYLADYNSQQLLIIVMAAAMLFFIAGLIVIYRGYVTKIRLSEQLSRKNEEMGLLNEKLSQQNEEMSQLNEKLSQQNEETKRLSNEVMELTHSRLVFFTNISHELRTPLTLIADPVDMLLDSPGINGKNRELLTMVKRNALALQQLVGNILDFRKVQNGKMDLKLCRFDMAEALALWTGDFKLTAERKDISIHLDTTSFSQRPMIVADKEKMSRIMFNLLSNALKYTPSGGDIYVTLREVGTEDDGPTDGNSQQTHSSGQDTNGSSGEHDSRMMRIDVRDTGKGISDDESQKVFERFFQAKGTANGTGIGLALVKSFVELHHGKVWVENAPGHGADFAIVMPCHQEGELQPATASDTSSADHAGTYDETLQYADSGNRHEGKTQQLLECGTDKPTVLIIDDNSDIRLYERTLLQDDYIVLEAADGHEGLEVAKKEVPDLVVCDVMMPVMDGLAFTENLKTYRATSHIPVIMLTAKSQEEHRAEGYDHGADSYITKPFHSKVLLARIANLLRQRQLLRHVYQDSQSAKEEIEQSPLGDRDKLFMKQLHDIIQQRMSDSDLSVDDIGNLIGLSRAQLYRKVKAMTGLSIVELLRKARLSKAHSMLEAHSMSISEVAYRVGFSAPSYFTKCFKEEYGMLPGDVK